MAAGTTKPYQPPEVPAGKVNITDPDSKVIPDGLFFVQGYNAQAAVNEQQIVLAERSPTAQPTSPNWTRSSPPRSPSSSGLACGSGLR